MEASRGLRDRLRETTRTAHAQVEQTLGLEAITSSLANYGRAMQAMDASLSGVLRALGAIPWDGYVPDLKRLAERRRWLLQDLGDLGLDRVKAPAELDLRTAGEGLGCLYVIEGSALGGLAIAREARRRLSVTPERGARYFHGLGQETRSAWADFLADLNRVPVASFQANQAEAGALATFEFFESTARQCAMESTRAVR